MKRTLIATIVGTLIIFIYQSISWTVSPIHKNAFKYTAAQDNILAAISSNITEEGLYMMPNVPPGTSHTEAQAMMKEKEGKPGAFVNYTTFSFDMVRNMVVGFILDFFSVWIIVFILSKASCAFTSMGSRLQVSLLVYLFVSFQAHLMEWNWLHIPMHFKGGEIIDTVLSGILLGWWLGWYLGRAPKTA